MRVKINVPFLKHFYKDEDGNATIEFVIIFPIFMVLFLSAFEMGLYNIRHVMLERGLDLAVRAVRLGTTDAVEAEQLRDMICNGAGIIPSCQSNLKIEMIRMDLLNWQDISRHADCIDRNDPAEPVLNFNTGGTNDLMILRVCALFDPIFPSTGLGFQMPKESGDAYALVSLSAFVMEPG